MMEVPPQQILIYTFSVALAYHGISAIIFNRASVAGADLQTPPLLIS